MEPHLPVEVAENRLSALLQSLLLAACLGATPLLRLIPTAVLVRPPRPAAPRRRPRGDPAPCRQFVGGTEAARASRDVSMAKHAQSYSQRSAARRIF